jgi:23S rRNA (adenine2503-C2)-methyltransferase
MLPEEAEVWLESLGEPSYRARQILRWIHRDLARSYEEMSDLPAPLRNRLEEIAPLAILGIERKAEARDGTAKVLLSTRDENAVEAVLMRRDEARTACISTQVGCPLACAFCATGRAGFRRNLDTAEIVEQFRILEDLLPGEERLSNVVLMGMGEPLLNWQAVARAVRVLTHPKLRALSPARITLSTAGIVPGLEALASSGLKINVALSLNAVNDALRKRLMPGAASRPLAEVLAAFKRVPASRRNPRTLEYVLLAGVNDRPEDADGLADIARKTEAKVNLIPFNEVASLPFRAPEEETLQRFLATLSRAGVTATVRRSRGADIRAACGQLFIDG